MENLDYDLHNGQQHSHRLHRHHSKNQSFSSALLDVICKSTKGKGGIMADKKTRSRVETRNVVSENTRVMRNSSIERQWEEDPWLHSEKPMRGRSVKLGVFNDEKTEAEAAYSKRRDSYLQFQSNVSSTTDTTSGSSDYYTSDTSSSISCPYLSSDSESLYVRHTSSNPLAKNSHNVDCEDKACKWAVGGECSRDLHGKSWVRDENFRATEKPFNPADHHAEIKSKSKTGKDSKKPKQPYSPGRKLASFLNSLFMAGGTKKTKLSSSSSVSDSNSYDDSSERKPASILSYSSSVQSRPCLSKISRGSNKSSGMSQKSVAFYPTSAIVQEDSRPSGEKCLHRMKNPNPPCYPSTDTCNLPALIKELELRVLEEDRHAAAAAAKKIIVKYQNDHGIMEAVVRALEKQDEEDDEDDDDASCSSSDLFELENLAGIDLNNAYQKELPVYGTTHLETNKAIAKGLIV